MAASASETPSTTPRGRRKASPQPRHADTPERGDEGAPWQDRWGPKTRLPAGLILFHGTSARFDHADIEGPAWFTTSKDVAEHFAERRRQGNGGKVRIMKFRLAVDLLLPRIENAREMNRFAELFQIDTMGTEDMQDSMRRAHLPGWIIPDNYETGDDIMIAFPDDVLSPA